MLNLGLLASDHLEEFRVNTLSYILNDKNCSIKVAFIDKRPRQTLKQRLRKNIKRGRGGYIFIMAFKRFFSRRGISIDTKSFCDSKGIQVIETNSPYDADFIELVKSYNLDALLLVGGYGIVKSSLLNASRLGVLSYHHGDMRKYRGMPPGLWELFNNEKEMGVTVQILSPGLDCGIPIEEKKIPIQKGDTVSTLQKRALKESEEMLHSALKKLLEPDFKPEKLESFGKVYTLPNMTEWIKLNLKILSRKMNLS
jgi:methionyl-tRNA formyltransferase